jgi:serine/threonine protein kinase/tetratricopeptide (TPR) repeat protein
MIAKSAASSDREQRLSLIVLKCLEAMDRGEPVDRTDLLARHREFEAELNKFLDDQEQVDACAAPLRILANAAAAPLSSLAHPSTLGDFRILREVGRGGMGVVYEAEQISLARRVALKVLPFAATMDSRHLQRFQNEARAAASLEHPHIVPFYGVGCERGVHYYAMKFIEGQSLAELIRKQNETSEPRPTLEPRPRGSGEPQPLPVCRGSDTTSPLRAIPTEGAPRDAGAFRQIAEWGIQAAEALEHAHSLGIVHRDIKHANLMIDSNGSLWVTDFGLARTAAEAGLTMTGDVLGTLRYMSPEQALAKHGLVDHRTDVYSVGVTLYELLTGRPAVNGKDREEILNRITLEDSKPPRSFDATIPRDLETIVLKAMAKSPAERYATAADLASDLRRWLEDRPIQAKRPGLVQRSRKWARRHRTTVTAAAVALLVVLMLLGGGIGWVVRDRAGRRDKAVEALHEADQLRQEEKWSEALGAVRRAEEVLTGVVTVTDLRDQSRELAKDLEMARRLENILVEIGTSGDAFNWVSADAAYDKAFQWYGLDVENLEIEAAAERVRSRSIRVQLCNALIHWARMRIGSKKGGWEQLRDIAVAAESSAWLASLRNATSQADAEARRKALEHLADPVRVRDLPRRSLHLLASELAANGARDQAITLLRQARKRFAGDFWINFLLARNLYHSRPPLLEESIRYYTAAVSIRPDLSAPRVNLGLALKDKGLLDEAILTYQEAIDLQNDDMLAHTNLGNALRDKGQLDKAVNAFHEALRLKPDFAPAHDGLGTVFFKQRRLDEAIAAYHRAIDSDPDWAFAHNHLGLALAAKRDFDKAVSAFREAVRAKPEAAEFHNNLGFMLVIQGQVGEAITAYREAIRLGPDLSMTMNNLAWQLATCPDPKLRDPAEAVRLANRAVQLAPRQGAFQNTLGVAFYQAGEWQSAVTALNASMERNKGGDSSDWFFLAMAQWQLGDKQQARLWYDKAVQWMDKNKPRDEELRRFRAEAATLLKIEDKPNSKPE